MGTSVNLSYGHSHLSVAVPDENLLGVFSIAAQAKDVDETALLREALTLPIGSPRLRDLARPGRKIVIVTSDLTRPCPSDKMLPPVLEELAAAGVPDSDIVVVAALGLHRPMTETELEKMVGPDMYRRVRVINHDPEDTVRLGLTSRGTPVELFHPVVEADMRICLANLEFHYFAGYSGGAKSILPGCASKATVNANHAMMVRTEAAASQIQDNPVRADLEEGAAMVGVDFILNVVVGADHRIKAAVAGEVTVAHRHGCELVARRGKLPIPEKADIVLVSAGGYPKDINLYQAHKALDNAAYAVRDGGIIILLAECGEGFGNQVFETWLRNASSPEELLEWIQAEFVLGGHKAAAIGAVLRRARVYLVSSMPADSVAQGGMRPFACVDDALRSALDDLGRSAKIAVIPQGGSVLPDASQTWSSTATTSPHGSAPARLDSTPILMSSSL